MAANRATVAGRQQARILPALSYVSAADYEAILAIIGEAARGTADEPLPANALEMIRVLARCDVAAFFEGSPSDRSGRRVWSAPLVDPWTDAQKAIVDQCRLELPLYPFPATIGQAIRISDAMSQRRYRNLTIYREVGRSRDIEFGMDYWGRIGDGPVRGLRFDGSTHDFSDRTRDAVETLGRHLLPVLARHDGPAGISASVLTPREAEILAQLRRGRTNREIGRDLSISPHTVRKHLENAFTRIGVHSRAEAVAWTYRGKPD